MDYLKRKISLDKFRFYYGSEVNAKTVMAQMDLDLSYEVAMDSVIARIMREDNLEFDKDYSFAEIETAINPKSNILTIKKIKKT